MLRNFAWSLIPTVVLLACAPAPEGLAPTPDGDGPEIVFDFDRKPLPEIPFPNDLATRPDPSSPTGKRVNASMIAPTELEATARRRIDQLSGWGVYQPITVRFDAPIDLQVIYDRHRDYRNGAPDDYDFDNDAIYLIDVTPTSPTYLEPTPLDFGEGNFPVLLRTPQQYWEHDPKTHTHALSFETFEEDVDGNGRLDPGEDIDLDGVLDHPNVDAREDGDPTTLDPFRDLMSFWEKETNTLVFRPIIPLREKTTYAVVITSRLKGEDGDPVRSPFEYVNHASQTQDIRPALGKLSEYGLDTEDVAFAWSFTTQEATADMVNLRDGLYGEGQLAWLAEDFPIGLTKLFQMVDDSSPDPVNMPDAPPPANLFVLPAERLKTVLGPFAQIAFDDFGITDVDQLVVNHDFYAYHVSGKFRAPRLLDIKKSGTLDDRAWPSDLLDPALRDEIDSHEVQFWCAIPKAQYKADPTKPAPVVLYAHGYTSNKLEQLGLALHAKFGIAGCSIDAVLHGVDLGASSDVAQNLLKLYGLGAAFEALAENRMVDIDGDGVLDVGGEFFTGYMFRTRDNLRQTLLDWLTLVRLIRAFGTMDMQDVNRDGVPEKLGDFDADGTIDIGGEDAVFFASGTSLGGLMSSLLAGIEPSVVAAAPISGGAGLIDLSIRSEQGGVVEALMLRMLGPTIIGERNANGETRIYQLIPNGNKDQRFEIAYRTGIEPGNVVRLTNVSTGRAHCARVMPSTPPPGYESYVGYDSASNCSLNDVGECRVCPDRTDPVQDGQRGTYGCDLAGSFRVSIPADKGDELQLEVFADDSVVRVEGDERDCFIDDGSVPVTAIVNKLEVAPFVYRRKAYYMEDPLVALEDGYGFQRATPMLRRFLGIAQMVVEPADPAVFAVHYSRDPLTFREQGESFVKAPTNVMNVTTIGDPNVPVNTGVAIAKVAGFIELNTPDPRWNKTPNRLIIDEGVQAGIPWMATRGPEWGPVLVDIDNISDSTNSVPMDPAGAVDGLLAPRTTPPLRTVVTTTGTDTGKSGIVFAMENEYEGRHGFPPPGLSGLPFDVGQYMEHFIGWFFATRGTEVRYQACMAELAGCDWIPVPQTCIDDPSAPGC